MKINDVITEGWQEGFKHIQTAFGMLGQLGGNDSQQDEAEIDQVLQQSSKHFAQSWATLVSNITRNYRDKEDKGLSEITKQLAALFMKIGVPMSSPATDPKLQVKRQYTDPKSGRVFQSIGATTAKVKNAFDTIKSETVAGRPSSAAVQKAFEAASEEALTEYQRKFLDPYGDQQPTSPGEPTSPEVDLEKLHGQRLAGTNAEYLLTQSNAIIPIEFLDVTIDLGRTNSNGKPAVAYKTFVRYNGQWYEDTNPETDEYSLVEFNFAEFASKLDQAIAKISKFVNARSIEDVPSPFIRAYGSRTAYMQRRGESTNQYHLLDRDTILRMQYGGSKK